MSLKLCTTVCKFTHQTRPMAVSKRSQTASKGLKVTETLGAEHIRESHIVSKCYETLGAERSGASRPETFGAEYIRKPCAFPVQSRMAKKY